MIAADFPSPTRMIAALVQGTPLRTGRTRAAGLSSQQPDPPPTHPVDQGRHAVWPARFVRVSSLIGGEGDAGAGSAGARERGSAGGAGAGRGMRGEGTKPGAESFSSDPGS